MRGTADDQGTPRGLMILKGVRSLVEADLPEELYERKVPPVDRLKRLLRSGQDQALDGCPLSEQGIPCRHGEASWLATLDLL